MKKIIYFVFTIIILVGCSCNSGIGNLTGCETNDDCSNSQTCNLSFNKCEDIVFTPKWTYQMEKFDDVEMPYLFHEWDEIRIVDLKSRKFIKIMEFKYSIEDKIFRNPKNGKFYFFNTRKPKTDEVYGLMELDPKTGLVKLLTDNYSNIIFGNISDNGKVYLITNKPCRNDKFKDVSGIKVEVFDTNNYKDKVICVPTPTDVLYKSRNGKLYTEGGDGHNNASIYEIDPKDDSIRNVLAPVEAEGGWHVVTAMGKDYIYYTRHGDLYRVNIKTGESELYYFSLSTSTDGRSYYFNYDGFNIGDDLFVLTYNRDIEYSQLVKYNTKNKEATWLYSDVTPSFEAYYRADANCVLINKGVVLYLDDYELKQFNSKGHLDKKPVKKF